MHTHRVRYVAIFAAFITVLCLSISAGPACLPVDPENPTEATNVVFPWDTDGDLAQDTQGVKKRSAYARCGSWARKHFQTTQDKATAFCHQVIGLSLRKPGEIYASPAREPSIDFSVPVWSYIGLLANLNVRNSEGSAHDEARPVADASLDSITPLADKAEIDEIFTTIRDRRFLYTPDRENFARRISWLYPDDGCFARAAEMNKLSQELFEKRFTKVFAFGNLTLQTPYSASGSVSWWYHVAPIVTDGSDDFVLDPAARAEGPMLLHDWLRAMNSNPTSLKISICNTYAYEPMSPCELGIEEEEAAADDDQELYLGQEWARMIALGFKPEDVLGAHPPWLAPTTPTAPPTLPSHYAPYPPYYVFALLPQ